MTKGIIPFGFIIKYVPEKPGIVAGMFWKQSEGPIFLCDDCSLKELKAMDPPLKTIDAGWYKIQMELSDRGIHAATYHPKTSVRCEKCGLIIPVNLEQA
jgi:hypothetical protein